MKGKEAMGSDGVIKTEGEKYSEGTTGLRD